MDKWTLGELINLSVLQTMADNLYAVTGIPVGILDTEANILIATGWEDICTKFHRMNPLSLKRCKLSDHYVEQHLNNSDFVAYKCMNNLWEVSVPIIVEGEHIASIMLGQFFYEDEIINIDIFQKQAHEFAFDQDEYIAALKRVPVFSREKVRNIIEYYKGLMITLVESSITKLQYKRVNNKYSRLFNSMQDFVFVLDGSKRFIECNKPFDENLYVPVDIFIGKKFSEVLPSGPSNLLEDAIQRLENGNEIQPFDYSLIINNKEMWYSAQVSKVMNDSIGEKDGYMMVARDITESKYIMAEMQKAKLLAEEANNAKNTFIANISHELKTPITVIQSATQLSEMKLGNVSGTDKTYCNNYMKTIKQNCRRLLRLINNLIDVTKVDAGFMRLQLQNINIVRLVEKITMSVAEYAKAKSLNVIFNKAIEEKILAVDPDKIERMLLNLLSNAIKFTEKDQNIIVSIYEINLEIYISVKDTGIGIPNEKLGLIFERFNQINNILSRSHEGSGIGLSLVKSFAELHGGNISVKSKLGKGSEFIIKLPVKELDSAQLKKYPKYIIDSELYSDRLDVEFSDIYL
jgi:PAS domain S-box-containing protein